MSGRARRPCRSCRWWRHRGEALEQAGSPVKVNTQGLVAKIKFEAPLGGFLTEINGK
jgi:hypothetical protein